MLKDNDNNKETEVVREIVVERKSGFNFSEVIIIMIIAIIFGFLLGNIVNFVVFKDDNNDKNLDEFIATYNDIIENYYDDVDKEKLIDAGIKGMINYLDDPYATYFSGDASEAFSEELEGSYKGVGIEITMKDSNIIITRVFEGSPASEAGLLSGDIIIKINDADINGKTLNEILSLISSDDKLKTVNITVNRDNNELTFSVKKEKIDVPIVTSNIYENNNKKIGYLKIDIFSMNAYEQFSKELKSLEKKGIDSLIIDVRDNPGGYLTEVNEILCLFLDKKKVLYQLQTKKVKEKVYGTKKEIKRNYPVSVIINEESASASEILAGAFMESYGSKIVGVNSYGKGTVQSASDLKSGDTIKYTIQKWLTPKGNWINEVGITPNISVNNNLQEGEILTFDNDIMLKTAINEISK